MVLGPDRLSRMQLVVQLVLGRAVKDYRWYAVGRRQHDDIREVLDENRVSASILSEICDVLSLDEEAECSQALS